jgi:hypothetical protein
MEIILGLIFGLTFAGLFAFKAILRLGLVFPRLGRWLDSKLGGGWFDSQD